MRFDNFLMEDTKGFDSNLLVLDRYDNNRLKSILSSSWIRLRESLSNTEQNALLQVINENFNTSYKNIYYIPDNIDSIPENWKSKLDDVSKVWLLVNESFGDNILTSFGLIWVKLVSDRRK